MLYFVVFLVGVGIGVLVQEVWLYKRLMPVRTSQILLTVAWLEGDSLKKTYYLPTEIYAVAKNELLKTLFPEVGHLEKWLTILEGAGMLDSAWVDRGSLSGKGYRLGAKGRHWLDYGSYHDRTPMGPLPPEANGT